MGKRERKPLFKLKAQAKPALDVPVLVEIAASANSPTDAYDKAYLETDDAKLLMACRRLAEIKRDYSKELFDEFVLSVVSHRPVLDKSKKEKTMSPKQHVVNIPQPGAEASMLSEESTTPVAPPKLPLEHITVRAAVRGNHARVRLIQRYRNDAVKPIEAVYVFPMPDEASVTGCRMKIGERKVEAELKERQAAHQEYHDAVEQGHHGALLEQERPNIFTMNVGGIEPEQEIIVEVDYIQRVPWQAGGGRFSVPLVVAPRFIPGVATGKQGGGWAYDTTEVPDASRITPEVAREGVAYQADINVSFAPGFDCEVSSPSHSVVVADQTVVKDASVEFKTGNLQTDRDFVLVYAAKQELSAAVHVGNHGGQDFGLISLIPSGKAVPSALRIVFLLDVSGSMNGAKLEGLKQIVKKTLRKLMDQKLGHQVCVVEYHDDPAVIHPFGEITEDTIKSVSALRSKGGTMTGRALTYVHQLLGDTGLAPAIMLVSDGQTYDNNYVGSGVPIYTVGIDAAVNDEFLKGLARKTKATSEFFLPGEDYSRAENTLVAMLSGPVLRDVSVAGNHQVVGASDVFTDRPAALAIAFDGSLPSEVIVKGTTPDGKQVSIPVILKDAVPCDYAAQVWARERIRESNDQSEQVAVSLKYGVICNHTSFVAVSLKEVPGEKPERVEIPVNLPHTWDYDSVFGSGAAIHSLLATAIGSAHRSGPRLCQLMPSSYDDVRYGSSGGDMMMGSMNLDSIEIDDIEIPTVKSTQPGKQIGGRRSDPLGGSRRIGPPDGHNPFVPPFKPMSQDLKDQLRKAGQEFRARFKQVPQQVFDLLDIFGVEDSEEAEKALTALKLDASAVASWSAPVRAMVRYLLTVLQVNGLSIDKQLLGELAVNLGSDLESQCWVALTNKFLGLEFTRPAILTDMFGEDYVAWKFNFRSRPTLLPWSLIP